MYSFSGWYTADGILKRCLRCDPALARKTGIHVKTLHEIFGPRDNPTAANLFNIIACLQEHEGVRLQVVA